MQWDLAIETASMLLQVAPGGVTEVEDAGTPEQAAVRALFKQLATCEALHTVSVTPTGLEGSVSVAVRCEGKELATVKFSSAADLQAAVRQRCTQIHWAYQLDNDGKSLVMTLR